MNHAATTLALAVLLTVAAWPESGARGETPAPAYYELRIYTVTSNKLDGVVERFRDTVDPVRRQHGIKTIGYWSAPGTTNGGTFARCDLLLRFSVRMFDASLL